MFSKFVPFLVPCISTNMLEPQPLSETQTQTQTQTQNSQWELLDNHSEAMPQRVTWGQLFTKSITINDHGRKFVVFEMAQQFSEYLLAKIQ